MQAAPATAQHSNLPLWVVQEGAAWIDSTSPQWRSNDQGRESFWEKCGSASWTWSMVPAQRRPLVSSTNLWLKLRQLHCCLFPVGTQLDLDLGASEIQCTVRANCANSSRAAMCFCMSEPTQCQCSLACASVIWNWNQTHVPSGKKAAPPNPATDCDAIASAVAVICRNEAGDRERKKGVDTNSFSHNCSASRASASSERNGDAGSCMPIQTLRDLRWSLEASSNVCTWGLDPSHHLRRYPSRGAWRVPPRGGGGGDEGEKGWRYPSSKAWRALWKARGGKFK